MEFGLSSDGSKSARDHLMLFGAIIVALAMIHVKLIPHRLAAPQPAQAVLSALFSWILLTCHNQKKRYSFAALISFHVVLKPLRLRFCFT